jgi:glycosyltransferase involved in cell wall biosynthesis
VSRALHLRGYLSSLITDAWVPPSSPFGWLRRSLRGRFHDNLNGATVRSGNSGLLRFELVARLRGLRGWALTMARNRWFQRHAVTCLENFSRKSVVRGQSSSGPVTVFAYSYAALEPFRWARAHGWRTVLGQIDPGVIEERIVEGLCQRRPELAPDWQPAPPEYWKLWREESQLADRIIVNSEWSRKALLQERVPEEKLRLIPLAFEGPVESSRFEREVPRHFTSERPLRVLFLGQINLRKGISPALEAVRLLRGAPAEFWLVGPEQIRVSKDLRTNPQVRWYGPVARGAAADYYRRADVFLFPTFSDGFGLTQLEAQAWGLPVIASRQCGEVVQDGVNGFLLPEVSGPAIAAVLRQLLANPERLSQMAAASRVDTRFSLNALADNLLAA